ncbi:hypothetical protein [Pedobacter nutrimenti]|uniref:Uncharacterized protein n=1 Tax=Pedobacter nutrimenti TaxID=1241337 RepID=A0A318UR28_9SPHI|nr:hypothetical protein [Pedobacter nutrimenti]PYF76545.1 hypothetical protein B0O44_10116 [Pedobacter nutrimenti]
MKKVFFGLLVAAIAVGGSAFTSAQKKVTTDTYYYVLNQAGTSYRSVGIVAPDEDLCSTAPISKCVVGFNADHGTTVNPTSLPSGKTYESSTSGYITLP